MLSVRIFRSCVVGHECHKFNSSAFKKTFINGSKREYVGIKCLLCSMKFAYMYIYMSWIS